MTDTTIASSRTSWASELAKAAGLGLAVLVLAYVCVALPRDLKQITPIWLANAVVLWALLKSEPRRWPLLIAFAVAGNVAASFLAGGRAPIVLGLSAANVVEYVVCAVALRSRLGQDIDVSRPRDLTWLALICGLCAPLLSALVAAGTLYMVRHAPVWPVMRGWWLSNALGLMLVTPCLLSFHQSRRMLAERPITRNGWLSIFVLLAVTALTFSSSRYTLLFMIPPALAFVAIELEVLGAVAGMLVVASFGVGFTAMGLGPLNRIATDLHERALFLQVFLVVSVFAALPQATLNAQRRRLKDVAQEQTRWAGMAEGLAGVGYWRLDRTTMSMTWSRQLYTIVGNDPDAPVTGETWLNAIHADDREFARQRYRTIVEADEPPSGGPIVRLVRPDGEIRHVMGNMVVERDGEGRVVTVFGVVMDVTAQKNAELAISQSEARFRMLTENGSDVISHAAMDGRFIYLSPSVEYRMGYRPEELIGRSSFDLIHPEDRAAMRIAVGAQLDPEGRSPPIRVEYRARHKDGHYIWFEARPTVAFDEKTGEINGVTDVIRDISRRKTLEADLRLARAEAEKAAAVKAEFMANMSHELRTPLTAMLGFTKLVEDQPELSDQTRGYVERVSNAGKALRATVNDILDFSKLEAGQVDIKPRPSAVAQLTRETIELFEAQAQAKGLSLTASGLEMLPPTLAVDPDRLRQILLNLIGNAVKFTDRGGVETFVDYDPVDQRLSFAVTDTGPGMPADRVGQLFQRFSQVDGSSTRKHGGTGLGLAICKGLAEAMGGQIGVDSQEGVGSRFWFWAPAEPADADRDDEEDDVEAVLDLPERTRVLIVDDNRANRELVRAMLSPFDADMTDATDGDEAIGAAGKATYDVILMDLRMPRVGGLAAALAIRQGGPNARTPILAFSADASTVSVDEVFDGQIAKPLSTKGLVETLARALTTTRV